MTLRIALQIFIAVSCLTTGCGDTDAEPNRQKFAGAMATIEGGSLQGVGEVVRALDQDPVWRQHAAVLHALVHLRSGRPLAGLNVVARLKAEGELRLPILRIAGEALHRLGRLHEAQGVLSTLVSEFPKDVDGHRWLSSTLYDLGVQTAAAAELQIVATLAPQDYRPHWLLGHIYSDFEHFDRSVEHFRKALAAEPPDSVAEEIKVSLARSLRTLHQYDAAIEVLSTCRPSEKVTVLKAACAWALTQPDEARSLLSGVEVPEDEFSARVFFRLRADLEKHDGKPDLAIGLLKDGLKRFPKDTQLRYEIAILLREQGRNEEAAAEMHIWEENQRLKDRLVELNRIANDEPGNTQVRKDLVELCDALDMPKLADMWRISLDPSASDVAASGNPQK